MTETEEAERLQMRMQRIRRRMDSDVVDLMSDAQQLLDWKYYIRRHPVACVAAIAAAGFFLVPKARQSVEKKVYLDPQVSREVALNSDKLHVEQAEEVAKQGLLMSAGALVLNTLVRAGVAYAGQYLRNTMQREFSGTSQN
ncbi:hypothetical protein [Planctomicrobium piriforme]|uniref:Uncharacterized protein n=1 Tax=Planctomicrobium piriforme TaxID=1576369 RepID=A0A1I3KWG7_9PLAN|nr:hypothetical protein [Planctomicrobium piriforme]SFI76678.1 hypothetical protein SAMN05421753_11261 [Planctomicrobium piriforme]